MILGAARRSDQERGRRGRYASETTITRYDQGLQGVNAAMTGGHAPDSAGATRVSGGGAAPLVLHVFPSFDVGGAQTRFIALANLFGRDFRHCIVALNGDTSARTRLASDLDVRFPSLAAPKGALLANARRFRHFLRESRPEVMVTCNWGAIEFALANLRPLVRHIHVEDGFGPEEREHQLRRRVLLRRLALARSTVVLPSQTLMQLATQVWRLPRVRYLPNGVDLARFRQAPPRASDVITIGTVAGLRPEKNIARLIGAFARIAATRSLRLVVVGDGPQRAALQAQVAAAGLTAQVVFTGPREDTSALYAEFDIFALSSDTEQMPLSVLEAMATGLPVAATDVGDVRGMVATANEPFVTALAETALAAALLTLAADPARRAQLGLANRRKAENEFDQAVMAQRWRALWEAAAPPA